MSLFHLWVFVVPLMELGPPGRCLVWLNLVSVLIGLVDVEWRLGEEILGLVWVGFADG